MRAVVLGGSGAIGSRVVQRLRGAGHDVLVASRTSGVDVLTGAGLDAALTGADVVIDCLNRTALTRRAAVPFFTGTADHVLGAARRCRVPHLVLTSICNVTDSVARSALGYYAGKAAQEERYVRSGLPVTVVATTAWFTLAATALQQGRLGPVAVVPTTRLQPVHPDAAAAALVAAAQEGPGSGRVELAGPEVLRADEMVRQLVRARRQRVAVFGVPFPGAGFRHGAMLPGPQVPVDGRRYGEWLAEGDGPS